MLKKYYPSKQKVKMPAMIRAEVLGLLTALRSGIVGNVSIVKLLRLA
jgi:hypothetical protein